MRNINCFVTTVAAPLSPPPPPSAPLSPKRQPRRRRHDDCIAAAAAAAVHYLIEAASPQVVRYDDIRDGVKDKLNVVGIRGARHVTIDLLRRGLVLGFELCLDVGGCLPVLLSTCKTNQERGLMDVNAERGVKRIELN